MNSNRLSSLGLKVLAAYMLGALLSMALVVMLAFWAVQHDMLAGLELSERAASLAARVQFDDAGRPTRVAAGHGDLDWVYDSLPADNAYRVLDASGQAVWVSAGSDAVWPPAPPGPPPTSGSPAWTHGGQAWHSATQAFEHQGRRWYLQFACSQRLMKVAQRKFALPYLGAGIGLFSALVIVGFGLCAYLTLRRALRPLHDISRAAAAISPQALYARLRADAVPSEIKPLVDSFNSALQRLEHGYRLQQEFLANAAHELKTPLALIRAQIELQTHDPHTQAPLLNDVDYMTRQVQQLLLLAEASEVQNYIFGDVVVRELVLEALAYLQRMAAAAGVRLTLEDRSQGASWHADRGALFSLLKNLLENAIQHAPANSEVHVSLDAQRISVRDHGPGADTAQLAHLFDRFWRGPHRRDQGAGLGLAICQEIIRAHGWALQVTRAEPGLLFCVSSGSAAGQAPALNAAPR